jgi:hypothetical protein
MSGVATCGPESGYLMMIWLMLSSSSSYGKKSPEHMTLFRAGHDFCHVVELGNLRA